MQAPGKGGRRGGRQQALWRVVRVSLRCADLGDRALAAHLARFVNKAPIPIAKPTATWINQPTPKTVPEYKPQS